MGTDPTPGNGLRRAFDAGEIAIGVLDNAYSPTLVEFYGELGLDFVWIDLEHGGPSPWDGERLEGLLRAAEGTGTELLVRLPTTDPALVRKALDVGVRNLFLSRVDGPEAVERAVEASQFVYDGDPGTRGLAKPRASRWGLRDEYVRREDAETTVGVTIETRAALDRLDEILAVPELGFVFAGPLDLSVGLGHPGAVENSEVAQAVEEIRSAAVEAGVPLGGLGFDMDDVNRKAANGYQLLNLGSTTGAVQRTVEEWTTAFEGDRAGDGDETH